MSLLLDALRQAEENKKQSSTQTPADDNSTLSLKSLVDDDLLFSDAVKVTEQSDIFQATVPTEDTATLAQKPNNTDRAVNPEFRVSEISDPITTAAPEMTPPVNREIPRTDLAATVAHKTTTARPQQQSKTTLDPGLNIFSAGSKKATGSNQGKRAGLLLLLAVILIAMAVLYFWFSQQQPAPALIDDSLPYEEEIMDPEPLVQTPPVPLSTLAAEHLKALEKEPADTKIVTSDNTQTKAQSDTEAPRPITPAQPSANNEHIPIARKPVIEIKKRTLSTQLSVHLDRAYQALISANYNQAKTDYELVLTEHPKQMDSLLGLAKVLSHEGNAKAAKALYEKALGIDDSNTVAQLGLLYTYQEESSPKKLNLLQDLSEKYPQSSQIVVALGDELAGQNKWPEAQKAYFQAFSLSPSNPVYAYNLAVSLDQMGKYVAAKQYYQKALQLNEIFTSPLNTTSVQQRLLELGAQHE